MKYKTSEIAKVFKTYYSALYDIRAKETQQEEENRKLRIQEYLEETNLPKITLDSTEH